ncbi:uracil-DNA glycosylase [Shimia ponticola]|uniref:uracil-DNA glycosylase n=1 Tax=Shimia ponticola TaxID=2582893 RepID=UPI0011BD58AE|nr:uracil-DNA glycosylase [Shimia ponticola]
MSLPSNSWSDLGFFHQEWPALQTSIAADPRDIFPPEAARFRALDLCPPEKTRVVILGQDPYHTPGKADGLAFSIPDTFGGRLDALGNIFKEIQTDLGFIRTRTDLTDWAKQGVLLLNTALSVPSGTAKGHAKIGWGPLIEQVITETAKRPTAYLLWGRDAQSRAPQGDQHLILKHTHPSPLSAYRGFFGSRPFSTINEWLIHRDEPPIDWVGKGDDQT